MWRHLFFVAALLVAALVQTSALDCATVAPGLYCNSANSADWCSEGNGTSRTVFCPEGTLCACGYVPEAVDPCVVPDAPLPEGCTVRKEEKNSNPIAVFETLRRSTQLATCDALTTAQASAPGNKVVVSYFTNWAQYRQGTCKFDTTTINGNIFTHINFAFAKLNSTFDAVPVEWNDVTEPLNGVSFGNYDQITSLKVRYPHLKVIISFGGWNFNAMSDTSSLFPTMVSTAANRAKFIASAMAYTRTYNFDGVDIDWEYPAWAPQGGSPADKPNFTSFLKEFRAAIDAEAVPTGKSKLLLTIAAPAGVAQMAGYELDKIGAYLDWINIMGYDLHGSWENGVDFHTALYSSDDLNLNNAVNAYIAGGVPANKLVLGLATYGRTWTLTDSTKHGPKAPASGDGNQGSCTAQPGFLSYYEIQTFLAAGATEVYDDTSKSAYAYKDNQWVCYDNAQSMDQKLSYIKTKDLRGGMIWSMDLDSPLGGFNVLQCQIALSMYGISGPLPPATPVVVASTPTVHTPTVSTPTVSTPTVSTPTVHTPTVSTPTVSTPTVSTPTVKTPTVSTPTVSTPTVHTPTVSTPTTLPVTEPPLVTPYYSRRPSEHLQNVLAFDADNYLLQLESLLSSPSYNDPNVYVHSSDPSNSRFCSFHPSDNYDRSLNQIFIGRPTESTTVSVTPGITVRLPDRYTFHDGLCHGHVWY